jgi:hypothetical protein
MNRLGRIVIIIIRIIAESVSDLVRIQGIGLGFRVFSFWLNQRPATKDQKPFTRTLESWNPFHIKAH